MQVLLELLPQVSIVQEAQHPKSSTEGCMRHSGQISSSLRYLIRAEFRYASVQVTLCS